MARKTFKLRRLVEMVNRRNRNYTCSPDMREGWNSLLEEVLLNNDNYAGFCYLTAKEVPEGQLPGVERNGYDTQFPDDTRRIYYLK
jgi:hypothetical protein